jgi:ubiquinone/menaquinone biosynthesis C-methylase UbiE
MREETFKRRLVESSRLAGTRVLDLGCGTGTRTIMAKRAYPDADLVGLDLTRRSLLGLKPKQLEPASQSPGCMAGPTGCLMATTRSIAS